MKIDFEREKLLQFFFALKEQATEGLLRIGDKKITFCAAGDANASFIDASFKIDSTEKFNVAIDVQKFYSTLNALKTKTISIDFAKVCHFKGGKIERDVLTLTESTLGKQPAIPPLKFPVKIEIPSEDYIDILESIDKMGAEEGALPTKVWLDYKDKKFTIHSTNEIKETTKSEFDMISVEEGGNSTHKSGFGFDFLLKVAKIAKKFKVEKINVYIGTDFPVKFDMENEFMNLSYIIAPRIEDD